MSELALDEQSEVVKSESKVVDGAQPQISEAKELTPEAPPLAQVNKQSVIQTSQQAQEPGSQEQL